MNRSNEAMNPIGNFPKNSLFFVVSLAKPKNIVVFAFTYVLESFALFFGDFWMDIYSVDSDEARRWSIKRFITLIFKHR